ncbi:MULTISPECIES: hypothetical protein [Sphingosinicellaceae]|uniref:hypothetical protein n=1 Tax=Sandarakinorhabdus sp. TaxID=1916663 RepID=UPI00286DE66B|nr:MULTISPECIES: hypothetical protein [Sphingosinicellaceae]
MKGEFNEALLDKFSVASAHIDAAIELFFRSRNLIGAHTLAWAALEVMRADADEGEVRTSMRGMEERIRPEHLVEFRRYMKSSFYFFKHSGKDDGFTRFDASIVEYTIFFACYDYHRIYGANTWKMSYFSSFFLNRNPDYLKGDGRELMASVFEYFQGDTSFSKGRELINEMCDLEERGLFDPTKFRFHRIELLA